MAGQNGGLHVFARMAWVDPHGLTSRTKALLGGMAGYEWCATARCDYCACVRLFVCDTNGVPVMLPWRHIVQSIGNLSSGELSSMRRHNVSHVAADMECFE